MRPRTPPPPRFVLIDPGPKFSDLMAEDQALTIKEVDEFLRPAVQGLASALSALAPAIRVSHNHLRSLVEGLDEDEVIPLKSRAFKDAAALTRKDLILLLDGLERAWDFEFDENDQDLFARVCGPRFDRT